MRPGRPKAPSQRAGGVGQLGPGATTGSDEPATEEGVDLRAGDQADATTDGGPEAPPGAEPDLKDAASGARQVDRESAD